MTIKIFEILLYISMYTFLLLSLFFIPMLYAEHYQTELDNNQEMLIPRSAAASYLFGLPTRRYYNQLLNVPIDSSSLLISSDQNDPQQQQQRAKRIYWENLAFHAADFNQKAKKL